MLILPCPQCGAQNASGAEVCEVCHASLAGVEPQEAPEPHPSPSEDESLFPEEGFSEDAGDLPDLLHSLKQEPPHEGGLPEISMENLDEDDLTEDAAPAESRPDWLDVVRQRAQTEEDSAGELIRKISAAQNSLSDQQRQDQREDFEAWIQKLREEARDQAAADEGQALKPEDAPETPGPVEKPDWLTRVRKAQGTFSLPDGPDAAGRNLLDWLVALEEERAAEPPLEEGETTQPIHVAARATESDVTQRIRLRPTSPESDVAPPPALARTADERLQADLLTATISDEVAERPRLDARPAGKGRWATLGLGLWLIAALSWALFGGWGRGLPGRAQPPAALALQAWAGALPAEGRLLVVIDYHPGTAGEMGLVAQPVLEQILGQPREIGIVWSSPDGGLLAETLLTSGDSMNATGRVTYLGYFPGEAYGAFGVASGATLTRPDASLATSEVSFSLAQTEGVLILSDRFVGAQGWIEQVHSQAPEVPLYLLVTAQAAPLLHPYVESGQVDGMMAGLGDAVGVEPEGEIGRRWRAYQMGMLFLMGCLALGALGGLVRGPDADGEGD